MFLMLSAALALWGLLQQSTTPPVASSPSPDQYAGVEACRRCHAEKVRAFLGTGHALTSRLPTRASIAGSFDSGANQLTTANPALHYLMTATNQGFFQSSVTGTAPDTASRTERIDIVTGSGKRGPTYLWWRDTDLFQLPVSYWTEAGSWVNSPGFSDTSANFQRPVVAACLDCHATYFEPQTGAPNRYNKTNFILGITCEKCHGPGAAHVAARGQKRIPPPEHDVVNPGKLSRERRLDTCSYCHGGTPLGPPFSFRPGDPVGPPRSGAVALSRRLDVDSHGQQATALRMSRCFQSSAMTCETCHDVHGPQPGPAATSARCLTCHKIDTCGLFPKRGRAIVGQCADCHMPRQASAMLVSNSAGARIQVHMRTHLIKIYPETGR
jgi:hypothetical protein